MKTYPSVGHTGRGGGSQDGFKDRGTAPARETATKSPVFQVNSLEMVGLRAGLGFLVAVGTSLIVERQFRKHGYQLLLPIAVPPAQAAGGQWAASAAPPSTSL